MHPGDVVAGRFEIVERAGSGGMGVVYKALDSATREPVALKIVSGQRKGHVERFAREAQILADLSHPRIVRFIANGRIATGDTYLAMEWLEGEDLAMRLARGSLTLADSVRLAIAVADALAFAHSRGVVHRDLKPGNLFLVERRIDGLKILDFGIAHLTEGPRFTNTGMVVGTPGYMAPEQARGVERPDARADVFSLGCVLYECLTGVPAFAGSHFMAILARILFDEPPRLRDRLPDVPRALDALVTRMLSKFPDDRPRDAHELGEELRALGEMPTMGAFVQTFVGAFNDALTDGEQRSVAVILVGPSPSSEVATLEMNSGGELRREASHYGGHLEPLLDGSVAVMLAGASVAVDLAAQAARCALAMQRHAPDRAIALALGRGTMIGRSPAGPAIDMAAQLVRHGSPEKILLDETLAGLLDARFDVRRVGGGLALYGERILADGTRTLLGKVTPCVGRDRELGLLEQLFAACVEESEARAVLVTAQPGAGKSRLAQEFLRGVAHRSDAALWIGRGDPLRSGSPFGLLGQAIRGACGIVEGEPLEDRQQKLADRVALGVAEDARRRVTEFVGEIVGAPFPDEESPQLRAARKDARLMNDQMRAAFVDLLGAELDSRPVVIVLEDLHWADRPTATYLDRALRDLAEKPLFLLALARPEVESAFPGLWKERPLHELHLGELKRRAIERLAKYVLGSGVTQETIDRLSRLSEGNAFALEELIRVAAEGHGSDLPQTVVAMVQSRLGALGDDLRRILRAASVLGEVFWEGSVAALLGGTPGPAQVREALRRLVEQEVVVKRQKGRFPHEEEYSFRHALLREGAYALLTDEDRTLGHRLAGEWLEARGEQDARVLAEHFEKGGEGARAGDCYLRAAEQALASSDVAAAVASAQRGLACPVPEASRHRLLGALCDAGFWHPQSLPAALSGADELVRDAPRGSLPWSQGKFAKLNAAVRAREFGEILDILQEFQSIEPAPGAEGSVSLALTVGTYLLNVAGLMRASDGLADRLRALAAAAGDREPLLHLQCHFTAAISGTVHPVDAYRHCESAIDIARSLGYVRYLAMSSIVAAIRLWQLGAFAEAEAILSHPTMPDDELGYGSYVRLVGLVWVLHARGALDEARACAEKLVELGRERSLPMDEAMGRYVLAEMLRKAGELDAAEVEIKAALAMLESISPVDYPGALATLAALRLGQGRPAEAVAASAESLVRIEAMGGCSIFQREAALRLLHAECLEAAGDRAAAESALRGARDLVLATAEKLDDPVRRATFLDVAANRRAIVLAAQWLA